MEDVILDVDTGVDDALALLLAVKSPALNLIGVTCVAGNVGIHDVVQNTLKVLETAGAFHTPVAKGIGHPLIEPFYKAERIHGQDGLGGVKMPEPIGMVVPEHAVQFLRERLVSSSRPITLVSLAPLTNIAILFMQYPEVKSKIKRLAIMGGAFSTGNVSPVAEFNVRQDPESADIVFRSGVPIVMYGLDVFTKVRVSRAEAETFLQSDSPATKLAGNLLLSLIRNNGLEDASIGDSGCVTAIIDPAVLSTETYPVQVELNGMYTRGQTVVDRRPYHVRCNNPQNIAYSTLVSVGIDVNSERCRRIFMQAVSS